jgi:hypothetical protein
MANVMIDIAAEFVGNKAFKQADTATDKLTKNVKKLAGAFGLAFGTQQILAYGKAAVQAAAADEKAQRQLALALKNVGLGRDAASSEAYIQRLQSEFGIVDDLLRPAYQTLAVATRDSGESQRLLNLALDISASTGKDLGAVTTALSRAYLGNNAALTRLGVGISKADLKTKSFVEITEDLANTFKGSATEAANTLAGSMAKLEVASANVSEILGKGIIDSLQVLTGNTSVEELAVDMETAATNAAAFLVTLSKIVKTINAPLMAVSGSLAAFVEKTSPFVNLIVEGDPSGFMKKKPKPFSTPMSVSGQVQVKQQKQITKLFQQQAVAQSKITKDKRLQQAIDKANLALSKGEEVFDMDKIQVAAALTNQAEQLGKATSQAQLLQIANDTARLNIKQSISNLEDAIASKDEASIVAATKRLNEDLKIFSALSNQNVKLADIKSILDSLKPVDLINQSNLDKALASIQEMLRLLAQANAQAKATLPTSAALGSGIPKGDYIAPISTAGGSIGAILEYAEAASARANAFADLLDMENASAASQMASTIDLESIARSSLLQGLSGGAGVSGAVSGSRYAAQAANAYNITIQAGIGDPEAIARAVEDVVRQSYQRGTSATGLLAV